MTYEQAVFFKILLSLGYCEDLNGFVNEALEKQEPLSQSITIRTCFSGADFCRYCVKMLVNTSVFTPLFPCINKNLPPEKSNDPKGPEFRENFDSFGGLRMTQYARIAKTKNRNLPKSFAFQPFGTGSDCNALATDIILELSFALGDINKLVSLLNEYASKANRDIDYDNAVFNMLLGFLREKRKNGMPLNEMSVLMHRAALMHPSLFDADRAWYEMYLFDEYVEFDSPEGANARLDLFLQSGKMPESPLRPVKQTVLQAFFSKIRKLFD